MNAMIHKFCCFVLLLFSAVSIIIPLPLYSKPIDKDAAKQSVGVIQSSRFRISVDGGFGYLLASTKVAKDQMKSMGISDQEADRYYREIKLGEQAGASIHYMINRQVGIGFDYNIFTTKSEVMGFLTIGDNRTKYYGPFKEKIYTSFLGISAFQNQVIKEKWNLYGKLSAGLAFYRNESMTIIAPGLITGNGPAIRGESGISYSITGHISVNVGISYLFSTLSKVVVNDGTNITTVKLEGDMKENLSRLSLSTGVQFHF